VVVGAAVVSVVDVDEPLVATLVVVTKAADVERWTS
jgi:hypothetical protein